MRTSIVAHKNATGDLEIPDLSILTRNLQLGRLADIDLLSIARNLAVDEAHRWGMSRTTAAALLVRQALEEALDAFWRRAMPGLEDCSGRSQMIALPFFVESPLAEDVIYAWYRLSSACHAGSYVLGPSLGDIERYSSVVRKLQDAGARLTTGEKPQWSPVLTTRSEAEFHRER
jgi:hypothetical protein